MSSSVSWGFWKRACTAYHIIISNFWKRITIRVYPKKMLQKQWFYDVGKNGSDVPQYVGMCCMLVCFIHGCTVSLRVLFLQSQVWKLEKTSQLASTTGHEDIPTVSPATLGTGPEAKMELRKTVLASDVNEDGFSHETFPCAVDQSIHGAIVMFNRYPYSAKMIQIP